MGLHSKTDTWFLCSWEDFCSIKILLIVTKLECFLQVTESLHKTIVKRRMSHVSGGGSIDLSDTDSLQEWINMTGFLSALGGVCLQHRSNVGLVTYSPPMGPVNERKGSVISMVSTEGNAETPVSKFLDRLLSLMVCNNEKVGIQIRTNIKDLVGLELSPALYPMLFNKMKNNISKFFDSQGQVSKIHLLWTAKLLNMSSCRFCIFVWRCNPKGNS